MRWYQAAYDHEIYIFSRFVTKTEKTVETLIK